MFEVMSSKKPNEEKELKPVSSNDPTENLKRQPKKGILKQSASFEVEGSKRSKVQIREQVLKVQSSIEQGKKKKYQSHDGDSRLSAKQSRPSGSKAMKFDEMNILETLHPADKDYGHMKIDEPNTPFEKALPDETDSVDPNELLKRLEKGKEEAPKALQSSSESEEEEEESEQDKEKRKAFVMKRKAHYNEFLAAKQALQALEDEDEDEEE